MKRTSDGSQVTGYKLQVTTRTHCATRQHFYNLHGTIGILRQMLNLNQFSVHLQSWNSTCATHPLLKLTLLHGCTRYRKENMCSICGSIVWGWREQVIRQDLHWCMCNMVVSILWRQRDEREGGKEKSDVHNVIIWLSLASRHALNCGDWLIHRAGWTTQLVSFLHVTQMAETL